MKGNAEKVQGGEEKKKGWWVEWREWIEIGCEGEERWGWGWKRRKREKKKSLSE